MWLITRDRDFERNPQDAIGILSGMKSAVGVASRDYTDDKRSTLTERFKMYDDDNNLIYEGVSDDSDSERAFDPLDDYGKPNFGCTYIKYQNKQTGQWEVL